MLNLAFSKEAAETYERSTTTTGHISDLERAIFLNLFRQYSFITSFTGDEIQQNKNNLSSVACISSLKSMASFYRAMQYSA